MSRWPLIRDLALFTMGALGVIHETVITRIERPSLLLLFAAMMGLPAFLNGRGGSGGRGKR